MAVLNVKQFSESGRKLYEEEFKDKFAPQHDGELLAIDLVSKTAYLGKTPLEAMQTGRRAKPSGAFYLVRIGSPGIYQLRSGRFAESGLLLP